MANYTTGISNISSSMGSIDNSTALLGKVKEQSGAVSLQMETLASETSNGTSGLVSDIERTRTVLREVIAREPGFVAAPVKLESELVFRDRTNLDFLMPGIVSIVLMFVSFLLASITIVQERARKTLTRTLLTPLSLAGFIFEKTAALLIIAQVQGVILLIVAYLVYNVVIPADQLLQLFIAILVYSAAFIGIGMALATFAESENTAMLSSLVLSIPMLFLSGIFFPFETMPDLMVALGRALPITMGIRALESVLIYQENFSAVGSHLLPLIAYSIIGLAVAHMLLRKEIME
ncbi:MAG TPA: ABC transporter permease [Candidatus Methanoperedenaceae archaeon]|nr:ABC transporter permease [Candidatus Methanoperedenaceae archaeon]